MKKIAPVIFILLASCLASLAGRLPGIDGRIYGASFYEKHFDEILKSSAPIFDCMHGREAIPKDA